jgi:RimJ/RimL family protein N-acetyltransferase
MIDWKELPTIEAKRVCLRHVTEADTEALFEIFSNPEVMRYWSTPPLPNRDAAIALGREIQECFENRSMLKWGLALRDSDVLIGTVTLFNLNSDNGRAEIGYCLGRKYWGNGYMNEALRQMIDYFFTTLNLRRLEADVDPRNVGSIRTVERLGFQREGYLRQRWHVDGEIQDSLFYGLLRDEWQGQ